MSSGVQTARRIALGGDYTQTYATAARTAALSDASEAHNLGAVFLDTEAEAALNALGARINEVRKLVNAVVDDLQLNV